MTSILYIRLHVNFDFSSVSFTIWIKIILFRILNYKIYEKIILKYTRFSNVLTIMTYMYIHNMTIKIKKNKE